LSPCTLGSTTLQQTRNQFSSGTVGAFAYRAEGCPDYLWVVDP